MVGSFAFLPPTFFRRFDGHVSYFKDAPTISPHGAITWLEDVVRGGGGRDT